ncbi:MAG: hypothetical protein COU25_00385 [Candidatus Levybacteria bacterium CG10_big_fil_rev_8_21_14_0_10_35_13]|nr:MAG: hypothetical protein COU25_00385 [Candidatus Levybacteria bacterium CG10_big_fil_rev_8_21_14_0_10_35_13]
MLQRKRRLKKNKSSYNTKIALFAGFMALVISSAVFIIVYFFYSENAQYINPLSVNKNSPKIIIEDMLESSNIKISRSVIGSDDSIEVELKQGGKIIFSSKKDLKKQISSLQLILSRLTIDGKKLKILDFRYDNSVVSFY